MGKRDIIYLRNTYPKVNDMSSPAEAINCKDGGFDPILELFVHRGKFRDVFDAVARLGLDPAQTLLWTNLRVEAMLDKT